MASNRQYTTTTEVNSVIGSTPTDAQISLAEELVDQWAGVQEKAVPRKHKGEVTAIDSKTVSDTGSGNQLQQRDNFFTDCRLEIVSGDEKGQVRNVVSSSYDDNSITYEGTSLSSLSVGDSFVVYQVGKFPRRNDVWMNRDSTQWFKRLPEAVKRATIFQVQFILEQGAEFFDGGEADFDSESIGNYSYSRKSGASSLSKLVSPKARSLLQGIRNIKGKLTNDNPTGL